jgi:CBS domain containing-hemolysin-like protein
MVMFVVVVVVVVVVVPFVMITEFSLFTCKLENRGQLKSKQNKKKLITYKQNTKQSSQ